jgi:predicted phosphodiesterase
MKIRLLSDLHLESHEYKIQYGGEDLLVLAGDISPEPEAVLLLITEYLAQSDKARVIFVLGNHDYFHSTISEIESLYSSVSIPRCHILQNDSIVIDGIRFYGTTLWSDLRDTNMALIQYLMGDYHWINNFTPQMSTKIFLKNRELLNNVLDESAEPVVVITHHLPSYQSVDKKYHGQPTNPAFASHLDHLVIKAKLWMHGHTHTTTDYKIKDTRVVCNPRGHYKDKPENEEFDDNFIVEI